MIIVNIQDKKITIVHREPHLLSSVYPDKFRIDVDNRWTQRQILLELNDQIDEVPAYPAASVVTRKGQRIDANLVVRAVYDLFWYPSHC